MVKKPIYRYICGEFVGVETIFGNGDEIFLWNVDEKRIFPPQRKTCGEDTGDNNYDNCWTAIDPTDFTYPEHGGTIYIQLTSNLGFQIKSQCQRGVTGVHTKFKVSHSRMPTPSPTLPPTPSDLLSLELTPGTWGFFAAFVALMTLGLGLFVTFLRKGSKAVEFPIPKTAFIMLFIGVIR